MEKSTGMLDVDLQVVVEDVRSFVIEVNPKFLTTLKYKFSKADYLEVASIAFKFWATINLKTQVLMKIDR